MAMRTLYNINETVQSSQNGELPEMAKQTNAVKRYLLSPDSVPSDS